MLGSVDRMDFGSATVRLAASINLLLASRTSGAQWFEAVAGAEAGPEDVQ